LLKSIACAILFLCLALSLHAQTGTPDYSWYGNGSAYTFSIATADQLAALANLVNGDDGKTAVDFTGKTINLTADINLSTHYGTSYNSGKGWIPIGHKDTGPLYFYGVFDDGGHTISGLYINSTDYDNTGLFGGVSATRLW
jgi:hypothetical protein